jgi:phytoene/squalene synthetase
VADLVAWARDLMHSGAPLAHAVPGRAGWELRLVVQGGLRILEAIERVDYDVFRRRPKLGARDWVVILFRALRM